ncbi:MAG TPA: alpha/beta hydrolase [Mycobacterium sp.]|jgi:pimeloyl-ACP methyl ester carboxylesterase
MPTTYALIPGAGGSAWYWHRVTPLLTEGGTETIAIDLPADDDSADLTTYADTIYAALAGVQGPVILVAQSMGAFTAAMVAGRVRAELMVLVNPMVPTPGEAPGQWWEATGQEQARIDHYRRIGLQRNEFDPIEDFFHDVPQAVRQEAFSQPEPRQSDTPFAQPWPLDGWPAISTHVLQGSEDRLFPLDFQRRVVRDRLGMEVDVMPGGHLMALSRPRELADRLESYRVAAGL